MIRFMICDTDREYLSRLAVVLHQEFNPCSVEYMYGPSALEVSLREDSGGADILLTEIELYDENAIEIIGKYLKASSPLQVIYMTSKMEYCMKVYDTRHCGFLMKPIPLDRLVKSVERAKKLLAQRKAQEIVIQKGTDINVMSPATLLYVESQARIIHIVTDEEKLETYDTIDHFSYQLDKRFIQCHKSYVINMERVKKFCGNSFLMENDAYIPISQSRRKSVREEFLKYIGSSPYIP